MHSESELLDALSAHEPGLSVDAHASSLWQDDDEGTSDNHHLVPARLVRVAHRLKQIDESDDTNTIAALSRMKLPQMTGQIRDIEQRALEIQREQGREEVRGMISPSSPLPAAWSSSTFLSPTSAPAMHTHCPISSAVSHQGTAT